MDVYRTEEEQVAAIQKWWQQNGKAVLVAVVLAVASYAGWVWYKRTQLEASYAASGLYQTMMQSYQEVAAGGPSAADAAERMGRAGQELAEKHGDTVYAQYAALMLASRAVEQDDYATAEKHLRSAQAHDGDASLAVIIANRLARVIAAQGKHDDALALLAGDVPKALVTAREETRGDILLLKGNRGEARAAWQKALDAADEQDPARSLLTMKLDYVAGE